MGYEFSAGGLDYLVSDEGSPAPVPKFLTRWPQEYNYLEEKLTTKNEYKFGDSEKDEINWLNAQISLDDISLVLAAGALDSAINSKQIWGETEPEELALLRSWADKLENIFNTRSADLSSIISKALEAAAFGFSEGSSAFQEVAYETQAWNPIPMEIRDAIGNYATQWGDVFFGASYTFKAISERYTTIQSWMKDVISVERRIREFIDEVQQERIQQLEAYIAQMDEWAESLRNFNRIFDKLVIDGREFAKRVIEDIRDGAADIAAGPIGDVLKWAAVGLGALLVLKFIR